MKNLNDFIDQWIGEAKENLDYDSDERGHNRALKDLKSRKQELIEGIVKIIENLDTKCDYDEHCLCAGKEEILEVLTGK